MAQSFLLLTAMLVLVAITGCKADTDHCELPKISNKTSLKTCFNLFKSFETALMEEEANGYILRKALLYSPLATPVLLGVSYSVTYNIPSDDLPLCLGVNVNETLPEEKVYDYAWTSTGVFAAFHPALLNVMQFQIPFTILRIIQLLNDESRIKPGPHLQTLLWDRMTVDEIPSITLQLTVDSLPCVPSKEQLDEIFKDITSLLRVYAHQEFGSESNGSCCHKERSYEYVGYGLSSDAIHTKKLSSYEYTGALFGIVYIISLLSYIVVVIAIGSMLAINTESIHTIIVDFSKAHRQLYKPAMAVSLGFIGLELFLDIVVRIAWAASLDDPLATSFLIILTFVCHVCTSLCVSGVTAYHYSKYGPSQDNTQPTPAQTSDSKDNKPPPAQEKDSTVKQTTRRKIRVCLYIVSLIILIFGFAAGYGLVYILAIAKTSVISFGPLVVVSLLPSIGISAISYVIKQKFFNQSSEEGSPNNNTEATPKTNLEGGTKSPRGEATPKTKHGGGAELDTPEAGRTAKHDAKTKQRSHVGMKGKPEIEVLANAEETEQSSSDSHNEPNASSPLLSKLTENNKESKKSTEHIKIGIAVFIIVNTVSLFVQYSVPTFLLLLAYPLDVTTILVYTAAAYFALIISVAILTKMLSPNLHLPCLKQKSIPKEKRYHRARRLDLSLSI